MTTSTNPWAPPEEPGDDAVLARLEMMIEPSFDDIDLPRPAESGAELPWLSGGTVAGIEPDFDTAGLPAPASPDALHAETEAQLRAPLADGPDVGPPAFVPAGTTADVASGGLPHPPPPASAGSLPPPGPGVFSPPSAHPLADEPDSAAAAGERQTASGQTAAPGQDRSPTGSDDGAAATADWSAPDPATISEQQLPSPMAVRAALEASLLRRESAPAPRRASLTIVLVAVAVLAVVGLVAALTLVLSGDDEGFVPVAVVPTTPSGEVVEEAAIPLVLPAFTPVERTWSSIDVRIEDTTESSTTVLVLSGPADGSVTRAVTTIQPIDLTVSPSSDEVVLTDRFAFSMGAEGWVRTPVSEVGVSDLYGRLLVPRTFEMVVPPQMRPLVSVVSVESLGGAGLRRYTLELRAGAFATQYPEAATAWAELVAWSAEMPERTTLVVDVDDTGLVSSSTVTTVDGLVVVNTALSDEPSSVEIPTEFSRGGAPS